MFERLVRTFSLSVQLCHDFHEFFVTDFPVAIDIRILHHFFRFFQGELFSQMCHQMHQLFSSDKTYSRRSFPHMIRGQSALLPWPSWSKTRNASIRSISSSRVWLKSIKICKNCWKFIRSSPCVSYFSWYCLIVVSLGLKPTDRRIRPNSFKWRKPIVQRSKNEKTSWNSSSCSSVKGWQTAADSDISWFSPGMIKWMRQLANETMLHSSNPCNAEKMWTWDVTMT